MLTKKEVYKQFENAGIDDMTKKTMWEIYVDSTYWHHVSFEEILTCLSWEKSKEREEKSLGAFRTDQQISQLVTKAAELIKDKGVYSDGSLISDELRAKAFISLYPNVKAPLYEVSCKPEDANTTSFKDKLACSGSPFKSGGFTTGDQGGEAYKVRVDLLTSQNEDYKVRIGKMGEQIHKLTIDNENLTEELEFSNFFRDRLVECRTALNEKSEIVNITNIILDNFYRSDTNQQNRFLSKEENRLPIVERMGILTAAVDAYVKLQEPYIWVELRGYKVQQNAGGEYVVLHDIGRCSTTLTSFKALQEFLDTQ